jgi:hypothetical protein
MEVPPCHYWLATGLVIPKAHNKTQTNKSGSEALTVSTLPHPMPVILNEVKDLLFKQKRAKIQLEVDGIRE